ncbi:MAG: hypothetical protein U9P70_00550 [Patescibacteria group bacterium]|nr:hypothetical protein [Patescibacteria group bacterium]
MLEYKKSQLEGEIEQVKPSEESPQQPERKLTPDKLREKLCDPNFLPTHKQITKAFTNLEQWVEFCFDEEKPVFEFFNEEYLNAFADYFVGKIQEYGANEERPLVILEIGAGNGRLSYFLQQKLEERAPGQTEVIATDSGEWTLKSDFPIEQLKHDEAIEKHSPDIVVFSWMPYQEDSSEDIRKFDSVQEYILIGETDGGCCGNEWETWGWSFYDDEEDGEKVPPYEADGFKREDLDDLSDLQICRTDYHGRYHHSKTVSFKRKK